MKARLGIDNWLNLIVFQVMDWKTKKLIEKRRAKEQVDPAGGDLIDSADDEPSSWGFKLSGSQECL